MVVAQPVVNDPGIQLGLLSVLSGGTASCWKWITKLRSVPLHRTCCLASVCRND